MMIEVIDKFLDQKYMEQIQNILIDSAEFPWYYNSSVVHQEKTSNYQFIHMFYNNMIVQSHYYELLLPCIEKLNVLSLIRIKSNLIPRTATHIEHGYHVDTLATETVHKTAVLYVNTNDGYTVFRNGERVQSIANRLVVFDSNIEHSGSTCTDENIRVVINFNYVKK
jgi:hypothetical protein